MTAERRVDVVIVNSWERGNRGDAVLLECVIAQVRETLPGSRIRIAGIEAPGDYPDFAGVENLGSTRRWMTDARVPSARHLARRAVAVALFVAFAVPGSGRMARWIARICPPEVRAEIEAIIGADVVIAAAGGYLHGGPSIARSLLLAGIGFPLWVARAARVPVVCAPQSFGPFVGPFQTGLVRRLLGGPATRVLVREGISLGQLRELGVQAIPAVDPAFAYRSATTVDPADHGLPVDRRLVLVTARSWLDADRQRHFESELAAGLGAILDRDPAAVVVLVPQVACATQTDDDRPVHARIAAAIRRPGRVFDLGGDLTHDEVWALYRHAHTVIGTRFHSVIFGLSAGVPAIAIQYEHKTRGIMRDLGLERWVIDMDDVTAARVADLHAALDEEREACRARLRQSIGPYARRADRGIRDALVDVVTSGPQPALGEESPDRDDPVAAAG